MFNKRHGKRTKQSKESNAMIVVERTKKRIFRYVPKRLIPSLSFEKKYKGNWIHILGCNLQGQLLTIERPKVVMGRMPTDLYMAKHCADEVEEVYGLSMPLSEKIKIGILVGLCVAILIVIFLIASASGGS